jgi:PadR family transcriptional regulator PadR
MTKQSLGGPFKPSFGLSGVVGTKPSAPCHQERTRISCKRPGETNVCGFLSGKPHEDCDATDLDSKSGDSRDPADYPGNVFRESAAFCALSYGHHKGDHGSFFGVSKGARMDAGKSEVLQGTLDMMILKTLHALGPLHGFGIARRIEQLSEDVLELNEGTVYTSLLRLQHQRWIASKWGTSENNRKAKFYSITRLGMKQLALETENWERIAGVIGRVLRLERQ